MSWLFLSLFFAFTNSINNVIFKSLTRKIHQFSIALGSLLFSLPFLFLIVLYFYGLPRVNLWFWAGVSGSALFNIFATLLQFSALRISDVSLLVPFSAFHPVFTTIVSFLILKEAPSVKGLTGIILVCLGGYCLHITELKKNLFEPIKKLMADKGIRLFLGAHLLWAFSPTFEKIAISHTHPQAPPLVVFAVIFLSALGVGLLTFLRVRHPEKEIYGNWKIFSLTGILRALGLSAALIAYSLSFLGYATAVFRTSIFFTIILAYFFLNERRIKDRLLGASIMFIGVLLLVS